MCVVVGEERVRLQPHALEDPQVKHLMKVQCIPVVYCIYFHTFLCILIHILSYLILFLIFVILSIFLSSLSCLFIF